MKRSSIIEARREHVNPEIRKKVNLLLEAPTTPSHWSVTIPCHEAAGNIIADVAKKDTTQTTTQTTTQRIIEMMRVNSEIAIEELAATCKITRDGINYHIRNLKKKNKIRRIGGDFGGHWEVIDDKES